MTAGPPDYTALAKLHAEAFAPLGRGWDAREIASIAARGEVIEAPGGFALISTVLDEAELLTIAVLPARRREGVGRELLLAAMDIARRSGAAKMHLEVAADNAPARRLYESAGFEKVGARAKYYARRDGARTDAVLYAAKLADLKERSS